MIPFKFVFAGLTFGCMLYFLVLTRKSALQRLFVVAFFGTGFVFILQPDWSTRLALRVGIGRGADLIFYVSTLFLFFICFNFYIRFRAVEERQTRLVRELALLRPHQEEAASPGPTGGGGGRDPAP